MQTVRFDEQRAADKYGLHVFIDGGFRDRLRLRASEMGITLSELSRVALALGLASLESKPDIREGREGVVREVRTM